MTGGTPDAVIIREKGRHVWIEFKLEGNEPTPLQLRTMARMAYIGAEVLLVTFYSSGEHMVNIVKPDGWYDELWFIGKKALIDYLEG